MPLKPDTESAVNEWIESQRTLLSPAEFEQLQKIYSTDDRKQHVATTVMMRADYGRQTQQAQQDYAQKLSQLESEANRLSNYDKQLAEWETYVRNNTVSADEFNRIQAERNQLEAYRTQTEAKIKSLGMDELIQGLEFDDPNTNNNNNPTTQTNPSQRSNTMPNNYQSNPSQPPAPFATQAIVDNKINEAAIGTVAGVAQLMALSQEYQELTGKPLPNPDRLLVESLQAQRPIMDYVQEKLEFSKLRSDKASLEREAEITRRVNEVVAKQLSQNNSPVPGGMNQGATSPIMGQTLQAMGGEQRENLPLFSKPGQVGRAAAKASEAFLQGKYRNEIHNPWRQ